MIVNRAPVPIVGVLAYARCCQGGPASSFSPLRAPIVRRGCGRRGGRDRHRQARTDDRPAVALGGQAIAADVRGNRWPEVALELCLHVAVSGTRVPLIPARLLSLIGDEPAVSCLLARPRAPRTSPSGDLWCLLAPRASVGDRWCSPLAFRAALGVWLAPCCSDTRARRFLQAQSRRQTAPASRFWRPVRAATTTLFALALDYTACCGAHPSPWDAS
jgi:hypothetical protein